MKAHHAATRFGWRSPARFGAMMVPSGGIPAGIVPQTVIELPPLLTQWRASRAMPGHQ
jgi:hypothetical protein